MAHSQKRKRTKKTSSRRGFFAWLAGRTPAERGWRSRVRRILLVSIPAGIFLFVALVGVAYALVRIPQPSDLATARSTLVLDRHGTVIARLHAEADRVDVPASQIPGVMRQAAIAAEDHSFYQHGGVSIPSIFRAAIADLTGGRVRQGGSTITQQYVKNAYVGNERSVWRKIKEAIVAIKIERKETKDEILNNYLNTIYFGRGAYGIEAASRTYFGTPARSLTLEQAALLGGIIRAPELDDPIRYPMRAKVRRDTVAQQMAQLGSITHAQAEAVTAKPVRVVALAATRAPAVVGAYAVEDVRRLLIAQFGAARVYRGGMIVNTAIDLRLQRFAEDAVHKVLDRRTDPEAALVSVDADTGEVLAMVGGKRFSELQFDLATQGMRQPGSSFKPFVLTAALEQNISLRSRFRAPATITLPTGFEPWKVSNYDHKDYKTLDLLAATEFSVNTVYAQLILKVGPDKAAAAARGAGITSSLAPVPSLALGTSNVSPLELAGAYADFANGGMHSTPHLIHSITDADRHTLFSSDILPERVMESSVANTVAYALTQVVQKGTGRSAQLGGRPVGGKTGTTESHIDAWFSGFTRQIATTVWMGYPDGHHTMQNVRGIAVTGGSFPAEIWRDYMEKAVDGMPVEGFGQPAFGGETLNATPSGSPSPSPSGSSRTVVPSLPPSKSPEPLPSPTTTKTPSPTPVASASGG